MNALISKIAMVQKDVTSLYKDGVIGISNTTVQFKDINMFKQVAQEANKIKVSIYSGYIQLSYEYEGVEYVILL